MHKVRPGQVIIVCALLWLAVSSPVTAQDETINLYQCKTIVTGTDAERRVPNMINCYKRTLVKVSGDQRLLDDRTINPSIEQVLAAVDKITLRDRLWRRPIHDEQGTRDRPHDLTVDFKPADIDAMLTKIGRKPWTVRRPVVALVVLVRHGDKPFVLTSDGDRGPGMTDAISDASDRIGLMGVVPSQEDLMSAGMDLAVAAHPALRALNAVAKSASADTAVAGILTWSDSAFSWIADWTMTQNGEKTHWHTEGVNFDEAYRIGLGGAAQILSGNIQP